jgi:hypothetical protein
MVLRIPLETTILNQLESNSALHFEHAHFLLIVTHITVNPLVTVHYLETVFFVTGSAYACSPFDMPVM